MMTIIYYVVLIGCVAWSLHSLYRIVKAKRKP